MVGNVSGMMAMDNSMQVKGRTQILDSSAPGTARWLVAAAKARYGLNKDADNAIE